MNIIIKVNNIFLSSKRPIFSSTLKQKKFFNFTQFYPQGYFYYDKHNLYLDPLAVIELIDIN